MSAARSPIATRTVRSPSDATTPAGVRAAAAAVAAALGSGWAAAGQDTLGELILRIWLSEGGVPRAEAPAATAGWGGDRLLILRGPDGAVGIGMITTWDTAADAAEFATAATAAAAARTPAGVVASDGLRTVYIAMGDRAKDILVALGG